jgi:hypothetical protein
VTSASAPTLDVLQPQIVGAAALDRGTMTPTMNGQAQAKSLAQELAEKLTSFALTGGRQLDLQTFEGRRLLADCERLAKDENVEQAVILGSDFKSNIYALAGDVERAIYWAKNADQNRGPGAPVSQYTVLTLLGYPKEALPLFDAAIAHRTGNIDHYIRTAVSYGWFARAQGLVEKCRKDALVHKPLKYLSVIPRAARIFADRGLTEDDVNDVTTLMYEVLRENKMVWLGYGPSVTLHDEGTSDAYVLMRFALHAEPARVAKLSWELTERIVAQDYDRPGLIVSFAPGAAEVAPEEEATATA